MGKPARILKLISRTGLGLISIIATCSLPAFAQQGPSRIIEEVVVTGTRIQRANLISSSPIAQVDAKDLLLSGAIRVEDMLKSLPQVFVENSATVSNGTSGTATLDLRGLGQARTLVLVDGRRLPQGSPFTAGAADINQIPGALVERVEVLTGGASAVYGSDALAGVVNFFLIDDFEGISLDYQLSQYAHDNDNGMMEQLLAQRGYDGPDGTSRDGDSKNLSLLLGANFAGGRGNAVAYLTYRDIEPVVWADRIFSACALNGSPGRYTCGGSTNIPEGRFTDFGLLRVLNGVPGFNFMVQGDEFVDYDGRRYNFAPLNYFQRSDERWTYGGIARYEFSPGAEAYLQAMLMDDQTEAQLAPSLLSYQVESLGCGNPLLSAQQVDVLCGAYGLGPGDEQLVFVGRRNAEGGPRQLDLQHESYRIVTGLRGDLNEVWRYDAYAMHAEVTLDETFDNELLVSRMRRALDVIADPVSGEPVCRSVVDGSDPACVPWNIFRAGGVTPDATSYLSAPLTARGSTDQTVFSAYVAANFDAYGWRSPFAESGIGLVFGAEYREENLSYDPDDFYTSGDSAGAGASIIALDDGYDVTEWYAELSVPLVENAPLVRALGLDLGYRYSDYSTGETTDTYKIAASWELNAQLRLRGSLQHAVRVPNIQELFTPQDIDFSFEALPDGDPCEGSSPARSLADCANTGVTPQLYGTIPVNTENLYALRMGGNPELQSEESKTVSFGFLYAPEFAESLTISFDWFEIEIEDAIGTVEPAFTMERCLDTGQARFCDLIHRDPIRGDLWIRDGYVDAVNQNIGVLRTRGFDLIVDYHFDVGRLGSVGVHNVLGWVEEWSVQDAPGVDERECGGRWGAGCSDLIPELRNHLRLTWTTPWQVSLSLLWRYIDELQPVDESTWRIDDQEYLDASLLWEVSDRIALRAGINNVFDEEPPIVIGGSSAQNNANTYPGLYDALGQYWFAGASIRF